MGRWAVRFSWLVVGSAIGCGQSLLVHETEPTCSENADCDDGDSCTLDRCDAEEHCIHSPLADDTPCGDAYCAELSWRQATCVAGACIDGLREQCDDANPCTIDGCDASLGCIWTMLADGTDCGPPTCTDLRWEHPQCAAGACMSALAEDCVDDVLCTADSCDPVSGCSNLPLPDGSPCGAPDCSGTCRDMVCVAEKASSCDDNRACTFDLCLPGGTCAHGNVPSGMNVLVNPGFDTTFDPWRWCADEFCGVNGGGALRVTSSPTGSGSALKLEIVEVIPPIQLFQAQIMLEPSSSYRILVTGRSPTAEPIYVDVIDHTTPFTVYGPAGAAARIDLTSTWTTHQLTFVTSAIGCEANARFRIRAGNPAVGDVYLFDHIELIRD